MRIILTLLLVSLACICPGQDDKAKLDEAAGKILAPLRNADDQEIIVHTDKNNYPLGSTAWFRVYLLKAYSHLPAPSARVYVDIVDKNDSIVSRTMLNSASNEWDGGIRIPAEWKEGTYFLRVYTAEMLLSPDIGKPFEKSINFFSRNNKDPQPLKTVVKPEPGISFYPEGGSLINGLPNTIAYRCFNQQGNPIANAYGYLRDERKEVVETFKTPSDGLGKFIFSPSKNRKYHAVIIMPDKTEQEFPIPTAPNDAWQIAVTKQSASSVNLRIAQGDSLYQLKPTSYLVGISNGKIAFASVGKGLYEVTVPLNSFPQGPAMFYLLNDKLDIVSTRQITVSTSDIIVSVTPNKATFAPRETVSVDVDLKDASGNPLNAIMSVSVTDNRYQDPGPEEGRNELLDIISARQLVPHKAKPVTDSTMTVLGSVLLANGQPAASHVVSLVSTEDNLLLTDTTDASGKYYFKTPEFYEGKPYMLQVTDMKGLKPEVSITSAVEDFNQKLADINLVPDNSGTVKNYILNQADSFLNGITRKQIDHLSTVTQKTKAAKSSDNNRNKFSRMITREQLDRLQLGTTANAVMMVPGVIMMQGKLTIRGGTQGIMTDLDGIEPLVILDGVPAGSTNVTEIINSIPPHLVDYIEVLAGGDAGMYGTRGANGVIIIKTNNELTDNRNKASSSMIYVYPPGYHKLPEFFMPKYEVPAVRSLAFIDNRSTIFWKGELISDKTGKARVQFYAADEPTIYTVTVKGISSKGDIIDKRIQIKR